MRYSRQYHDCLVQLWRWHKNFRGQGVRNTHLGVSITPPAQRSMQPTDPVPAGNLAAGTGQYQGMAYMNVSQNQMGSSYPFAHELK
jgi:hypothetical protein